ncbi:MAG TPA: LutB/LldF family L-lactate oxidation iron-sulfur protein [Xanthobacteraceae bacterium]|nr:LutB/LldF family L-lactate oxidation iron-sulfur protein [Xanthobacteraceae bacterium]
MAFAAHLTAPAFKANAKEALTDAQLQSALHGIETGIVDRRRATVAKLPEFDALRDCARAIKNHTLAHLDLYLEQFEAKCRAAGGHVHYAVTAEEARAQVLEICRSANARLVTKGKSMIGEEIAINDFLEQNGITPVETDLGEYLVQIRHELPSHIIMPAVHLTKEQIEADFRRVHTHLAPERNLAEHQTLLTEARVILRDRFLSADVGITGANFLIAETGTSIIVTNEGNGDLTQTLPRVHIVLASIEKVVPTLEDVSQLLRVLARSATAQEMSVYTTFSTGPRRAGDPDGPNEYHVIILDNGRTAMLGGQFREMLRCIRCGACMNHCPVYAAVGGHTYGWVYPGPMGAVLTPSIVGIENARDLPNASTFCGRCEEVCPVRIPLPNLMRHWREREFERHLSPATVRSGLAIWAYLAKRPQLYAVAMSLFVLGLGLIGKLFPRFRWLPLATGWTRYRDFPASQLQTFQAQWKRRVRTQ